MKCEIWKTLRGLVKPANTQILFQPVVALFVKMWTNTMAKTIFIVGKNFSSSMFLNSTSNQALQKNIKMHRFVKSVAPPYPPPPQPPQELEDDPFLVDDPNITNNNTCNTLFVGNMPFSIEEKDLYELFGRFGRIRSIKVNVDRFTGKSMEFGFVEFEGREDAEKVFTKFNNYELNGRRLRLEWKKNDRESSSHRLHNKEYFEDRERRMKSNVTGNRRYTPYDNRGDIKRRTRERESKDWIHYTFDKIKYLYTQGRIDDALQEYFNNPNAFSASFLITRENNMKLALKIYEAAKYNSTLDLQVIITFMKVLERRNEHYLINSLWDDVMTTIEKMNAIEISKINVITWSTLITGLCKKRRVNNALKLLDIMHQNNMRFDDRNYVCLLAKCNSNEWLEFGKRIHDYLIRNRELNIILKNCLINMYGKGGSLEEALKIFNSMSDNERDVITWTAMISAYGEKAMVKEALELFSRMQDNRIQPTEPTLTCVLKACCKSGLVSDAVEILFSMERRFGIKPEGYHYNFVLTACADNNIEYLGKKIHNNLIHNNYPMNIILKNSLINMYGKCKHLKESLEIFHSIEKYERDIVTWNTMILAYAENDKGNEALELFDKMQDEGLRPDVQTITCVLKACSKPNLINIGVDILFSMKNRLDIEPNEYHYNCLLTTCANNGMLSLGKMIHNHIIQYKYPQSIILKSNLINMYGKCGHLDEALKIFNTIKPYERNVITWTTMISAYGENGKGKEATNLFTQMLKEKIYPTDTTIVSILNACSHSGLVSEALGIFENMEAKFQLKPNLVHCNCIVDVLSRAGRLEAAELFILEDMEKLRIESDVVTWTALLGACRMYMDIERAEKIAQIIMNLAPEDSSVYVLLANIYAQSGNMEKRNQLRELMKNKGIKKMPGFSMVELNGKLHQFATEDNSHSHIKKILEELQALTEEMIHAGYNADTSWVTRDIESEEERKDLLYRHSERLAITWALMNTAPNSVIHITKNLRVCGDCHNATKLISKIREREIIVRDASRYHHFKDGTCSCGDYW